MSSRSDGKGALMSALSIFQYRYVGGFLHGKSPVMSEVHALHRVLSLVCTGVFVCISWRCIGWGFMGWWSSGGSMCGPPRVIKTRSSVEGMHTPIPCLWGVFSDYGDGDEALEDVEEVGCHPRQSDAAAERVATTLDGHSCC